MGFGWLLIGYLVTFVFEMTANALKVGPLVVLLGYALMLRGLIGLRRFCKPFLIAAWILAPLFLLNLYRDLALFDEWFLWEIPFVTSSVTSAVDWLEFLFLMIFHAAMLSAVRVLALRVDLQRTAVATMRNLIVVFLFAVLYVIARLPLPELDGARPYLTLAVTVLNLAFIFLNLILLLSCTKNICPEGEEDPPPKRYRWNLLNRIGDKFAQTQEQAVQKQREDIENHLRRRREKRASKKRKGK